VRRKLLTDGGSIVDADLLRRRKVDAHYNVMGVAKAALEASVRYLAADLGEKNIRVNADLGGAIRRWRLPVSPTPAIS